MGKRKIGDTEQHGDSPLSVRLSYKHRQKIQELALLLGSDQSAIIRQAVDAYYAQRQQVQKVGAPSQARSNLAASLVARGLYGDAGEWLGEGEDPCKGEA